MIIFKVVKSFIETPRGRLVPVWHVVDVNDGFVYDAFDLKRDALAWILKNA